MVKRKEFRKRSRYLAMLTALSLAFSNVGSCVNMVYAAEAEAEDTVEQSENEENSGEENADEKSDEESGDVTEEGGSEGEVGEEENSEEEGADGSENSKEEGSDSSENTEGSEDKGDAENGENNSEENVSEEGENKNEAENKADEQSGAEEEKNTVSEDGGSENSEDAVKEASEAKKGTYDLKYSVDPDEGAKIEGPSSVAAGKSAVFTVEAQDGYVIKNVSCESAEISTVEDVDTASASNAQKENAGKNDGEKFQTYQIESVEADAEIIIEMDNASDAGMLAKNVMRSADSTVSPDMSSEEIQNVIDDSSSVAVDPGDYSNIELKIEGEKKIVLSEGTYSGIRFDVVSGETTIEYSGNVVVEGGVNDSKRGLVPFNLQQGKLEFCGNDREDKLEIKNCGVAIFLNTDADKELLIETGQILISEATNTGGGIFAEGSGYTKVTVKGDQEFSTGKRVSEDAAAKDIYDTILSVSNSAAGICDYTSGQFDVEISGAYVELSDNEFSGFYAEKADKTGNKFEITDSCFISSSNKGTGLAYGASDDKANEFFVTRSYVEFNDNSQNGINGGVQNYKDSLVVASNNKNIANIEAFQIIAENTGFTADNVARYGMWLYDWDTKSEFTDCDVCTNKNGRNGIYAYGQVDLERSVVTSEENVYAGIDFRNGTAKDKVSTIKDSKVTTKGNGFAGITLAVGTVSVTNSVLNIQEGNYGSNFTNSTRYMGTAEYPATYEITGNTVAVINAANKAVYDGRVDESQGANRLMVTGGSLQMKREEATGAEGYSFNGVKEATGIYAAPVNAQNTMLTRFDLHQSANKEAASDENEFVYHDPNTNAEYTYSFRYNTADEDLNGTGGNAYVWAPVSVLHFDATEGKINSFGTAQQGNVALSNTRGDGSAVGNSGNPEQTTDRYATDYTIFGNSMNLTEGELPAAVRDGYKFAGWYVADNEGAARDYAASGNWAELNKLLNTRFTADSKVSEDITDVAKGQEEKTIYAKWVLPSQYNIVINYIDESTGAHISASYNSDYIEEGSSYDVASLLNKAIDGYTWSRYEGGQPTGSLDSDLVFNVYYNSNTPAPTPTPTPNRGSSSGSGGGSSTGRHASITTNTNAGPGVTITEENVPLADLPTDTVSVPENIPEEDVPLASLPKTGQSAGKEIALFVSAFVLGAAGIFKKKTKED